MHCTVAHLRTLTAGTPLGRSGAFVRFVTRTAYNASSGTGSTCQSRAVATRATRSGFAGTTRGCRPASPGTRIHSRGDTTPSMAHSGPHTPYTLPTPAFSATPGKRHESARVRERIKSACISYDTQRLVAYAYVYVCAYAHAYAYAYAYTTRHLVVHKLATDADLHVAKRMYAATPSRMGGWGGGGDATLYRPPGGRECVERAQRGCGECADRVWRGRGFNLPRSRRGWCRPRLCRPAPSVGEATRRTCTPGEYSSSNCYGCALRSS